MPRCDPTLALASASDRSEPIASIASRNRRSALHSSMFLASQTVQVTTEANTRPIMTAFTRMSADMNIDQGERSRGSWAAPIAGSGAGPWSKAAGGGAAAGAGPAGANGAGRLLRCRRLRGRGRALDCCRRRMAAGGAVPWARAAGGAASSASSTSRASRAVLGRVPAKRSLQARAHTCGIAILMTSVGLLHPAVGRGRGPFPTRVRRSQGPRVAPDRFRGGPERPRRPPSNG